MTTSNSATETAPAGNRTTVHRNLVLWVLFIGLSAATQLAFKAAGDGLDGVEFDSHFVDVAMSHPSVWLAIAGYIVVFVVWIAILKTAPLSRAFLLTALVYIPVTIGAWAWFGEPIGLIRLGGIALIVAGVAMLGVDGDGDGQAEAGKCDLAKSAKYDLD